MRFTETPLQGAFVIELEPIEDERGFFARSWCREEFASRGLNPSLVQCSISFNHRKGTVRGLHYQVAPHEEAKLVRCTAGALFDVIVDVRRNSATFRRWFGVELSATNRRMLYVPEGIAHGFQTLTNGTEVFYQMSESYHPECARGLRWDDPAFDVRWPIAVQVISEADRGHPPFDV